MHLLSTSKKAFCLTQKLSYFFFLFVIASFDLSAQDDFEAFQYRYVGPTRGGRATAVAGIASTPNTYYMGSTGGGVWKTEDYGTSWKNVSDGFFKSPSIGAIRVAQNDPNIVYVGTGSDGLRSNVITGKGMYKSIDAGDSWTSIGLENTGQIGAVEIHPYDNNTVFVAAIGQAFQPNKERGVYRTKDGGNSWEQVLFLSDTIGFTDLEFMPSNPNIIYAAAWRAERKPWTIISGGMKGGIYKSIDGGDTWNKVEKGLPQGLIGKIDLAVCPADSKLLFALVEAPDKKGGLYRSDDQGESFRQVSSHKDLMERAFYYTNLDVDPKNPDIVYSMARAYLKSTDGGESWGYLRPPHGDNHDMWINPDNPQLFIQANDGGVNVTHNGGKTWSTQFNQPTAELYQVEVDDQYPYWLYAGQQDNYSTVSVPSLPPNSHQMGGIGFIMDTGGCETGPAVPKPGDANIVYSNCKGRFSVFNKKTGQEQRYDVGAANMYSHNPKELKFRFQRVSPIHVSPHDPGVVYHTSQFVHKTTDEGKTWEIISPDLTAFEADKQVISGAPITRDITGEEFYSTIYAIQESKIQQGVIWVGANDGPVHVTRDGGQNWNKVTPNLPKGGRVDCVEPSTHQANKAYCTILRYQLGDWKPYIFKTENFGGTWTLLSTGKNGIPADNPVRVVREDPNREGLLYAGTEFGLYISFDDGKNWEAFQQNLPITPITDIKIHRDDLVLSTMGRGFWILDNINSLQQLDRNSYAAKSTLFKPKDTPRYRYSYFRGAGFGASPNYPLPSVLIDYYLAEKSNDPIQVEIINSAGTVVRAYISKSNPAERQKSPVRDMSTNEVSYSVNSSLETSKGFHRFRWDMRHTGAWDDNTRRRYRNGPYALPGKYKVRLKQGSQVFQQEFELLIDPRVKESGVTLADLQAQEAINLKIINLLSDAKKMLESIKKEQEELEGKNATTSEADQKRLEELKALKQKMETAQGRYQKPMLIDQISYLYGVSRRADQKPGKDVYDRFEELMGIYKEYKSVAD